jgi:glycosyltransferase involved in cell wall biosynthesis
LAAALVKKGVKVSVFVYHQQEQSQIDDEGVSLHLLATKRYRYFTWLFYRKYIQNYVHSVSNDAPIDLVEAPDWTGITAFTNFKMPLVIRFHGSDAYFCKLDKRQQKFKNFMFEKMALKKAKAYIAPTTYAGEETRKIFGLSSAKIKTIHYGLQLEKFKNRTPDVYHDNTLLYVGTLIRKKGVLELAKIFNKIVAAQPHSKLILIGGDASDIKTGTASTFTLMQHVLSPQALENTSYLGKLPYAEVQEHIKQAHVCAFPSFAETLGMVTIESMALKKPVVNTNMGWAQELIDDGVNGYLVHPSDIETYSERILYLFQNKQECLKIGEAARQKVETTFDIDTLALTNITYYKSLLTTKN